MRQGGSSGSEKGNLEKIGEGVGGLAGQAADMGLNMLSTMFGNTAGPLSGWFAQAAQQQQQSPTFGDQEDRECQRHFEASVQGGSSGEGGFKAEGQIRTEGQPTSGGHAAGAGAGSTRSYDRARPLYQFGHLAGQNPDYQNRSFEEIEPDLRQGWGEEQSRQYGSWPEVRGYVGFGYSQQQNKGRGGRPGQ